MTGADEVADDAFASPFAADARQPGAAVQGEVVAFRMSGADSIVEPREPRATGSTLAEGQAFELIAGYCETFVDLIAFAVDETLLTIDTEGYK